MNFTVDKTTTIKTIKDTVKADMVKEFFEFLTNKYGEENVKMVRTGNTTKVNEIGVVVGEVATEDGTNPLVVTINPSVKEFADRKTDKKSYVAFDFIAAAAAYEKHQEEQAEKAKEKKEKKEKNTSKKTSDTEF